MKILVLSDSHAYLWRMRSAVQALKPDAIIHLGDYFADGELIHEENEHIAFHQVPGNCDKNRMYQLRPEILCYGIGGVKMYMTHGHIHNVKYGLYSLLQDAKEQNAKVVLYGHTHNADCRLADGMWILNPGSCGYGGYTVGLIEVENGKILDCRIVRQEEWEELA